MVEVVVDVVDLAVAEVVAEVVDSVVGVVVVETAVDVVEDVGASAVSVAAVAEDVVVPVEALGEASVAPLSRDRRRHSINHRSPHAF